MFEFLLRAGFAGRFGPRPPWLLLILGSCTLLMACPMIAVGVPYGMVRAWSVASLPTPHPTELQTLDYMSEILITAQLPSDMSVEPQHGLALYYEETRTERLGTPDSEGTPRRSFTRWQKTHLPPTEVMLLLPNEQQLVAQISAQTRFIEALQYTTAMEHGDLTTERRITGYLPHQLLTIEGRWLGDNRVSASYLYPGSVADYQGYAAKLPFVYLLNGLLCGAVGLFIIGGSIWKYLSGG